MCGVLGEDLPGGNMERNQTGLVELGLADGKQSLIKIHVLAIQLDGLADAQSTDCQQPE